MLSIGYNYVRSTIECILQTHDGHTLGSEGVCV